jgi:hypothetical protein
MKIKDPRTIFWAPSPRGEEDAAMGVAKAILEEKVCKLSRAKEMVVANEEKEKGQRVGPPRVRGAGSA